MRLLVLLGASALALTACQSQAPAAAPPPPSPATARVGAAGSGCELPVSFGIQEEWKPKAVTIKADDPLAGLARRGPLTMVCEIDAKPSGAIGFLRVYTGPAADPKASLTAFIGPEAQDAVLTDLKIGDLAGVEVDYKQKSQLEDTVEPERAFAVPTGAGLVVVALDSLDSDEHAAMLPAYELARSSLTAS